ncbi:MAG: hypothetical protein AAFY71_23500 [Bacteroidota bacterium]
MKEKLKNFTAFTQELYPHEVAYLQHIAEFQDEENQAILNRIVYNSQQEADFLPFDTSIDKRKYSRIKKWIQKKLQLIDVDQQYAWITRMESAILQDNILPHEEKELLKALEKSCPPPFYLTKQFDLARHFRQYLLIRMRHSAYQKVNSYMAQEEDIYLKAIKTFESIHEATVDITNQYSLNNTESQQWEESLQSIFYDEKLDGLNRYRAAVRLNFIYINYREYERLQQILHHLDGLFERGLFYSRRILANYYFNRLLFHSLIGEQETAIKYGYLSIRHQNADYLHYVNSLSTVLLKGMREKEALDLLSEALPSIKNSPNSHTRVAFATNYIRCLQQNGMLKEGKRYAEIFLRGYKDQVLTQRWHGFFTAYIRILLVLEEYEVINKTASRYKLLKREESYKVRPGYVPGLYWYMLMAQYKEGLINQDYLQEQLHYSGKKAFMSAPKTRQIMCELIEELSPHLPTIIKEVKQEIGIQST